MGLNRLVMVVGIGAEDAGEVGLLRMQAHISSTYDPDWSPPPVFQAMERRRRMSFLLPVPMKLLKILLSKRRGVEERRRLLLVELLLKLIDDHWFGKIVRFFFSFALFLPSSHLITSSM